MSLSEIKAAIPHREPFLMIDEIVVQTDDTITCRRKFRADEWFFQGHYPDFPIVPGVLLCEACMQAGAVLLTKFFKEDTGMVPVATRAGEVKFKKIIRPGDTVDIEVKLNERLADAFYLTGKVTHEGKLAARLDFACTVTPKANVG